MNEIISLMWLKINYTNELNGTNLILVMELHIFYRSKQAQSPRADKLITVTERSKQSFPPVQEVQQFSDTSWHDGAGAHYYVTGTYHTCDTSAMSVQGRLPRATLQSSTANI